MPQPFLRRLCALALCAALAGCRAAPTIIDTPESAAASSAATAAPTAAATPTGTTADATTTSANVPTVLPQTTDAGRSYVDETLFLGDSNTARYMMYADDTGKAYTSVANNIGVVSMGAGAITTLKCEQFKNDNAMYTIPDAVAMLKPRRIVIGFGTNNLSGSSTDATKFIETYRTGLKAIVAAWPYADLIVSAIPPLDKLRDNTSLTMTQVDAYNAALAELCAAEGWHFLNSAEVLRDDSTGWAKKDYTLSDGVHLSQVAVGAYFNYLRTHAYVTEDRRPQPLGTLPTPAGSPVGLISSDPIAVRGAKVPVEFVAGEGGSVSGSTSQKVKKGATCATVTAVPNSGWKFAYWTASYGSVGSSASLSFTVPSGADAGGVVVTAHFTPDVHDHDYVEIEGSRIEPTCLTAGSVKYACSICGEKIEKELPALNHAWDNGVITQPATAGVPGVKTYTCTRCAATRTEAIAALPTAAPTMPPATPPPAPTLPPTPSAPTAPPAPTQAPPAPTQAPTDAPTQAPTEAPATEPPHTHSYAETARVEPTCEGAGSVTYQCACGDSYTEELAPLGHAWDAGVVTQEPQPGVQGVRTYTCTRCGVTRTEAIEALPDAPVASDAPVDPPVEPPVEEVPVA